MKAWQKFFLILLIVFFLMQQLAFAGQVEKLGKFKLEGNRLIINEREWIDLHKDTQVVDISGDKIPREGLNDARVIVIETDEKGIVKKITIHEGWY